MATVAAPPGVTPTSFAQSLLKSLGAPTTPANINSIVGWEQREGGNWHNSAAYNPLNTTQQAPGSHVMGGGNSAGVQAYGSWQQGLNATLQTLHNGNYGDIVGALKTGRGLGGSLPGLSKWSGGGYSSITGGNAAPGGAMIGSSAPGVGAAPVAQSAQTTPSKSYNVPDWGAAGIAALLASADTPITNSVKSQDILGTMLNNIQTGAYNTRVTIPGTAKILSNQALDASASKLAPGGKDINPIVGAQIGRTDMGVDATMRPGAAIRAINTSKVVGIEPNWFRGQPLLALRLVDGPNKGKTWYVAEQITSVPKVGTVIQRGHPVAFYAPSGTGIEMGWMGTGGQTQAQSTTGYHEGQVTPAGQSFRNYLGQLGA